MQVRHRRAHGVIWPVLAILLPLAFATVLVLRPNPADYREAPVLLEPPG